MAPLLTSFLTSPASRPYFQVPILTACRSFNYNHIKCTNWTKPQTQGSSWILHTVINSQPNQHKQCENIQIEIDPFSYLLTTTFIEATCPRYETRSDQGTSMHEGATILGLSRKEASAQTASIKAGEQLKESLTWFLFSLLFGFPFKWRAQE